MAVSNSPACRDEMPVNYVETLNRLAVEVRAANIRATIKANADASEFPTAIGPQAVAQLPWGHVRTLLEPQEDHSIRTFYAEKAAKVGWSRNVLLHQIKSNFHLRVGAAPSIFALVLPPAESELVQQMIKDPYNFEFLTLASDAPERDVETRLVANLAKTLQELGVGFYYAGRQHRLVLSDEDSAEHEFYLDLLFYHHLQVDHSHTRINEVHYSGSRPCNGPSPVSLYL